MSTLGAYFQRMCSRMDKPKAITAAAHKLARLIYPMLIKGMTTSRNATASASCITRPGTLNTGA